MKVSIKTPTIHPIIVPTTSSLKTFNFYLVENEEKLFLVDAGVNTDECWHAFINTLKQTGRKMDEIDAIIITHNHADHIGLVNKIRSKMDIPLYAHQDAITRLKRETPFLQKRVHFFENLYKEMGCKEEASDQLERLKRSIEKNKHQKITGEINTLLDGDEIFGFRIIEVPGHAPDHIVLYHEGSGIMLVGDHIIEHSPSNALVELGKNGDRIRSLYLYEQSLQKLLQLRGTIAYSGHGAVIHNPHQVIENKLRRIERKAERIKRLLSYPKTAAAIAKQLYKERYIPLLPLVMSEVIGHLDRLELMGEVRIEQRDHVYYYKVD